MFDKSKVNDASSTPELKTTGEDRLRFEALACMTGASRHVKSTWTDVMTGHGTVGEYLECGAETMAVGAVAAAAAGVEMTGLGLFVNAAMAYGAYYEQTKR